MKIGQIVKSVLDELTKQQVWTNMNVGGNQLFCIETTVDPDFFHAVEILIGAGLAELEEPYKHIEAYFFHDIYIRLYSNEAKEKPIPSDFFEKLTLAIDTLAKKLSESWKQSDISLKEILIPDDYVTSYGNEIIIYEQQSADKHNAYLTGVLLRIAAKEYQFAPDYFIIPAEIKNNSSKVFIIGKKELVSKFINSLSSDLSPISNRLKRKNSN